MLGWLLIIPFSIFEGLEWVCRTNAITLISDEAANRKHVGDERKMVVVVWVVLSLLDYSGT